MKLLNHKAGVFFAPALIILFYLLFVTLDLVTTYITSPDLKYEGNKIIRYFNLSWKQIIIIVSIVTIVLIYSFIMSIKTIMCQARSYAIGNSTSSVKGLFRNTKVAMSFLLIGFFFTHFYCSIFVSINNYLSYIFLFDIENSFTRISFWYITVVKNLYPHFYFYNYTFLLVTAFLYSAYYTDQIFKNYTKELSRSMD